MKNFAYNLKNENFNFKRFLLPMILVWVGFTAHCANGKTLIPGKQSATPHPSFPYTTPAAVIRAPKNVFAQLEINSSQFLKEYVKLEWDSISNSTQYYVYKATQNNGPYIILDSITTGLQNTRITYLDFNTPNNSIFYYKVKAIRNFSLTHISSRFSSALKVTTYGTGSPLFLNPGPLTSHANQFEIGIFYMHWNEFFPSLPGDKIHIYKSITGLPHTFSQIGVVDGSASEFPVSNISSGIHYYFYVSLERNGTILPPSNILEYTTPCGPLKNVIGNAVSFSTIHLKWSNAGCADEYTVYRSSVKKGLYTAINYDQQNELIDTGLTASTTYFYYVEPHFYDEQIQTQLDTISVKTLAMDLTYINFGNNFELAPKPWNNTGYAVNAGLHFNLFNQKGINTGVMKWLTSWSNTPNLGVNTQHNTGVYPDKVIRSDFAYTGGGLVKVEFNSLDTLKAYDFTFFASWAHPWSSAWMYYQIGSNKVILDATNNSNRTVTIKGVRPDHKGIIQLNMGNQKGDSTVLIGAIVLNAYIPAHIIPPPNHLTISSFPTTFSNNTLGSYVELKWDTVPGISKYYIYKSMDNGLTFSKFDSISWGSHSPSRVVYDDYKTPNASRFFYRVVAVSLNTISNYSNTVIIDTYGPNSPTLLQFYPQFFTGGLAMTWTVFNPLPGDSIQVFRSLTGTSNTFTQIKQVPLKLGNITDPPFYFLDYPLNPNTSYFYFVKLLRKGIIYNPSNIFSYNTFNCTIVSHVSAIASSQSITLDWTGQGECADNFNIYRSTSRQLGFSFLKVATSTHFTDSTVTANTTYYYYVQPHYIYSTIQSFFDTIQVKTPSINHSLAFKKEYLSAFLDTNSSIGTKLVGFPVPFQNTIYYKFYSPGSGTYRVLMYNHLGTLMYQSISQNLISGINTGLVNTGIQNLGLGLYLLKLESTVFGFKVLNVLKE